MNGKKARLSLVAVGISVVGAVVSPAIASAEDAPTGVQESAALDARSTKYTPMLDGVILRAGLGSSPSVPVAFPANTQSDPLGLGQRDQEVDTLNYKKSWWRSWGKCVAGTVGGALTGGGTGAVGAAGVGVAGGPWGAGAGAIGGGVVGGVGGGLGGAAAAC